ncbi:MAG: FHA domain-containing protein [Oscillospiraceae bacterium]|nr:FHA domain-containing protein [Oscillospiraceae bacterium]
MAVKKHARGLALLTALLLAAAMLAGMTTTATAANAATLRFERATVNMPEIDVMFLIDNNADNAEAPAPVRAGELTATLDGAPLNVENVTEYDKGTRYIFAVDVSGSMQQAQTNAIKNSLKEFRETMPMRDRMILLTFGEEVNILLHGGESKIEALEKIDTLHRRDRNTRFYDGILTLLAIAENKSPNLPDRSVAILFSDGLDDTDGGGHTSSEIIDTVTESTAPIYTFGFSNFGTTASAKAALDALGELARRSKGQFAAVTPQNLDETFRAYIDKLDRVQVARLRADNNLIDFKEHTLQLTVNRVGGSMTSSMPVMLDSSIPDYDAPWVTFDPTQTGEQEFMVVFSKRLQGADIKDNYIVTDESGKALAIQSVSYDPGTNTAVITFDGVPYTGEYTLRMNNITDVSMEKNPIIGQYNFEFKGRTPPEETPAPTGNTYNSPQQPEGPGQSSPGSSQESEPPIIQIEAPRSFIDDYWWLVLLLIILAVAALALVLIFTIKKHRGVVQVDGKIGFGDAVEFKHHFTTPDSARATLVVTDMAGNANKIDLDIYGSFFVGRSEQINNLSFDDGKLSRQHFVIEADADGFFISDLNSTNGTYLNGVPLAGKRKLNGNDVITAGNEKFVFYG